MANDVEVSYIEKLRIPSGIINMELEGLYGSTVLKEFAEVIKYYDIYEKGAEFQATTIDGFEGATLKLKQSSILIDKEARFMFSSPVDITVEADKADESVKAEQDKYQKLIDKIRDATAFDGKVMKAAKDCFIGKRIAYVVDFDTKTGDVIISFIPSLGFVYSTDDSNIDILTKLIIFYATNNMERKEDQRIYKKKYEMVNGKCVITEGIYNGLAEVIEQNEEIKTEFTYIPGGVILNGGLTGDMFGESDIAKVAEFESYYNKLNASDIDAERKNMNPITYTVDADPNSTKNLSRAAGAYWDLSSDMNHDGKQAQVGTIEPKMEYSDALTSTLSRMKTLSYEALEVPETSSEALKGVVSSGKTLKAIYWGLMVRCDEKFIAWRAGIRHIAKTIIDGCMLYPECARKYIDETINEIECDFVVGNNYPIQDDINEEKEMDLQEVHNKVRSKKSYMKKYMGLSDEEVDEELQQMAKERQIEEGSYSFVPPTTQTRAEQQNQVTQGQEATPSFQDFVNGNA